MQANLEIPASSDSNFSDHQSRRAENARILYDPCLSRSYGFEASIPYDHASPDHEDRFVTITSSGIKVVQGRWWEFVRKDTPLDQNVTIKKPISLNFSTPRLSPSVYELILYSYSGDEEPLWMRDERGKFVLDNTELQIILI
ncbi:hypothetical protein FRC11_012263 [Ceratobasidium sp. 423]|nr:hypothetical protein FRC11_012263 [Ceratobasidium sp. 423]